MTDIEDRIRNIILNALPKSTLRGTIKIDASSSESIRMTGSYFAMPDPSVSMDISEAIPLNSREPENNIFSQLSLLYQESCNKPNIAPWYRCKINITQGDCTFVYWREDSNIEDLSQLERDMHGKLPTFPFRDRFPISLLRQLKIAEYENAFLEFAPRAIQSQSRIPPLILGYYSLLDWQADTLNGTFDQYFARDTDWLGAGLERKLLYPEVRSTLKLLDLYQAVSLFEEAISLYAHFYPRVEDAREVLGIAAVPRQTESDIMDRFDDMIQEIENRQWTYFGEHLDLFATN